MIGSQAVLGLALLALGIGLLAGYIEARREKR